MVVSEHSINAKLLYALLLNRTMLSQKSGWVSEDGNVYVIYTIKQMANDLNRSERTVKTALCELENAGLLTRVRQGLTKANRLFLQIPDGVQLSSPLMGKGCLSEVQKTAPLDGQKLPTSNTNTEYKEQSKTERVESTRRRNPTAKGHKYTVPHLFYSCKKHFHFLQMYWILREEQNNIRAKQSIKPDNNGKTGEKERPFYL